MKQSKEPDESNAPAKPAPANSFRWQLLWWAIYAAAFGVTEAALVVYVRALLGYPHGADYAEIWARRGESLSVFAMGRELSARGLIGVELAREAGTIILLAGAAMAAGRTWRERLGVFCYTFALWDLTYYVYLAAFIGFPRSLFAVDVYFLIPITWCGPVWFPVCVVMPALVWLGVHLMRPGYGGSASDPASGGASGASGLTFTLTANEYGRP